MYKIFTHQDSEVRVFSSSCLPSNRQPKYVNMLFIIIKTNDVLNVKAHLLALLIFWDKCLYTLLSLKSRT